MGALLVYDGDCTFCTRCADFTRRRLPTRARIAPWQELDLATLGTTAERADRELLWISAGGRVHGGAQAVAHLLLDCGRGWAVLGGLLRLPPLRWLAHGVYRVVAANRHRLPGGTQACALPKPGEHRG